MSVLSIHIFPEFGLSKPPIAFNNVVLPHPEGPTIDVNSPALKSQLILFIAWTFPAWDAYIFFKFSKRISDISNNI